MKIVKTVNEVHAIVKDWQKKGLSVGFVPTMGYLHEGHQSLIARAASENDCVVVSIFVNPMQFGPSEDLTTYPRDLERDAALCKENGATLIFDPEATEMYFPDFSTYVDMDGLTEGLCGRSRPVHFRGVCTVVTKLFNIVQPDRAYFGQKDAQQLAVIKQMVRDLNMAVEIVGCPIIREADGLAKSSRNSYLTAEERKAALVLSHASSKGQKLLGQGERNASTIIEEMTAVIQSEPLAKIDYIELVDAHSLKKVEQIEGPILVALAVYIGKTRLIDNFMQV